ncbi:MAG TPA: acetylglutamate kinase [Candidatus Baltobacteraceae bacterium]|jgi:acetylglutamate kinase|nr:acetylglutamate kinase [Candidatus Baltobacteraceae bacterium]
MRLVVKHGGNAAGPGADAALIAELAQLHADGHDVVLVHGGGPEIDAALAEAGVVTERVDGLRVTDAAALSVVEAVLCASANKRLVRACLTGGVPAIGISGQDGGLLRARRARTASGADLGFVGEIVSVDPAPLLALFAGGYVPVVAPLATGESAECAYNVNADTAAGAIASALLADAFITLTNVDRVLADRLDPGSALERISVSDAHRFAASASCEGGMKPKILAAAKAVAGGAKHAFICAAKPRAIQLALAGEATIIA